MFKTVRSKLVTASVLFVIISAGIPIYILMHQFHRNFDERSRTMLNATAKLLRYELYNSMMQGSGKNIQNIAAELGGLESVEHIRIITETGLIKYSSIVNEVGQKISNVDPVHINTKNLKYKSIRLMNSADAYSLTEPIINEKRCQSCHGTIDTNLAYLDLDIDLTKAETIFFTGSTHLIFVGIAVLIVLGVGLYFIFTYFINRPLTNLNKALKRVEAGSLDVEIPSKKNDEIGKVYNRFNLMTKKLKLSREEIEELHFEQLQRADRLTTLGELTSQVAHEVNNHAAVIMSRADFLEMESLKKTELVLYQQDFKSILDQTNKISEITKNLLRHSKQSSITRVKINLYETIAKNISILEPLIKKKKIKYTLNSDIEDSTVIADPLQIDQVFTNLILNSVDAVEDNGMIEIILTSDAANKLDVTIKDDGCGIEPADMEKIFSPFYTSKPQGKGTGLGLYIVQNICKSNQIDIKCESRYGEGTTFKLEFQKVA